MTPKEWALEFQKKAIAMEDMATATEQYWLNALTETIQSALAERTEQCAKIAENRIGFIDAKVKELEKAEPEIFAEMDGRTLAVAGKTEAEIIAKKIRALNQPENKS